MKNISRFIAVAVLMLSAVAAFAQRTGSYKVIGGKVYYNNMVIQEANARTIQDLGYGYAKDDEYVWFDGKVLPLVDPQTFRLKHVTPPSGPVPPQYGSQDFGLGDLLSLIFGGNGSGQHQGQNPPGYGSGHEQNPGYGPGYGQNPGYDPGPGQDHMHQERGYKIIGNKVYYNGVLVSNASAHSFKDLGWGYAKDNSRVYYCGKYLTGSPSRFKVLTDGYAMDSFDVYYFGKEIEASTSGFKVLSDGYAMDAWDTYYQGKKVR